MVYFIGGKLNASIIQTITAVISHCAAVQGPGDFPHGKQPGVLTNTFQINKKPEEVNI